MDYEAFVHLFHILIVGSIFLYVGINREKIYKPLFNILLFLGFFIIFYHLYKIYGYLNVGKGIWVNLIHVFIVGPLLVYIGYNEENTSRKFFEILLMLGFASIGYHLYYLFK
jgi:hypothetical protein